MAAERDFRVVRGSLLAYRLFDVGSAIDLSAAERALAGRGTSGRARLRREGSEALVIASPPLDLGLGRRRITLSRSGRTVECEVAVRLFDFGVASVRFELAIETGETLLGLRPLADEIYDSPDLEQAARAELAALRPTLERSIESGQSWPDAETYTVVFVEELEGRPSGAELLAAGGLERLLLGEPAPGVSASEREDVLRHAHSYLDEDLVVIDWNSALVLEPSGSRDIPDVLEFATSQLLEMRYYDGLLDAELSRIHTDLARARQSPLALLWSPYGRLARGVLRRYLELTEFTERVDNALKVIGDFYLARVFQAAVSRFRTATWRDSVYRKQELLARVYGLLQGEVGARRSVLLETMIVILIVLEIVLALGRAH